MPSDSSQTASGSVRMNDAQGEGTTEHAELGEAPRRSVGGDRGGEGRRVPQCATHTSARTIKRLKVRLSATESIVPAKLSRSSFA